MYQRHKYKEDLSIHDIKDPAGSIKYDGGHYFVKFNKAGKPSFISRRQSVEGHYPDRTPNLPQFHDIELPDYAGTILSTELIHTGMHKDSIESHGAVSGILNSLPHNAISKQKSTGPVRAVLLDVIHPKIATYGEKMNYLKKLEEKVGKPDLFFTPDLKIGKDAIQNLIEQTREEGREGIIATSLTAHETNNPRLKVKHRMTLNLKIRNIVQEMDIHGKPKKSMGALELEDATGRYVGNVGTGFERDFRIEVWEHPKKWMNKLIQVTALFSKGQKLRSAVYNGEADGDIDTV